VNETDVFVCYCERVWRNRNGRASELVCYVTNALDHERLLAGGRSV
jgi:hypothetical protein